MVIWSLISQIMNISPNKLRVFHIMLPLQSLVLLKDYQDLNYTMKNIFILSVKFRRWFSKFCTFYKIRSTGLPWCLFYVIPESSQMYNTSSLSDIIHHYTAFFLSTISKCNKLDLKIHQFKTLFTFQSALIKLGRPISKTVFNIHNSVGLMFLTRLIIGLSHLNQRQFSHNFQDCLNSLHSCCLEVESVFFFFLQYHKQALNQRSIWS